MKFIHCADLHLNSSLDALSSEKARIRKDELIRSFERLVEYAVENNVRAIIIAGDMFDVKKIQVKTRGRVLQAIESNPDIDFLYLSGNHDEDGFLSTLEVIPNNLKTFTDEWTSYRYDDVVITGVKFTEENVKVVYDNLRLNDGDKNIVVLHGQIAGYKTDEKAELISIPKLKNKNIDYLALGHIHSYDSKPLDDRGVYCYAGCLEGRGFDEIGEKGFVLIDTLERVKHEFVKFSTRELYSPEYDITGKNSWYTARAEILSELKKYPSSSLIKLVLTGSADADFDIDVKGLATELGETFFFAKVYDKTQLKIDLNDYATDKSLKGEFVKTVMASKLDEQTKQKVILRGLNALKGKEN